MSRKSPAFELADKNLSFRSPDHSCIDDINNITNYAPRDTDTGSQLFQMMRKLGGYCVTALSVPLSSCGVGPIVEVPEGHRAAVLTFGKLTSIKPPGTYLYNVGSENYKLVNVQIQTMTIPQQTVITKDGISTGVDAVCFFRVFDVEKAVFSVQSYSSAIENQAQYTLEVILGEHNLDAILQNRENITKRIADIIETQSKGWGVHIIGIEIRDIQIPQDLVRVMASCAEASREGQAKVITAQAELEAAGAYTRAAEELARSEGAMQLRYLQTLTEISAEKNSTIIIPGQISNLLSAL